LQGKVAAWFGARLLFIHAAGKILERGSGVRLAKPKGLLFIIGGGEI
jgi:hypothetical protein